MMYLVYFFVIVLLIVIISYPVRCFLKFSFLDKITKKKILKIIICFIPLLIILTVFDLVNAIIIILHLGIFLFLILLFMYLYEKILKKDLSKRMFFKKLTTIDLRNIIAVILTIIYLGIGAYLNYHVFETKYTIYTEKDLNNFRILMISDSHVGTTFDGEGFYKHIKKLSKIDTDIFVIVGDFVDDDTTYEDMVKACSAFDLLNPHSGTYFVFGNHDRGYFNYRNFKEEDLVRELEKNRVIVLRDEIVEINKNAYLIAREDRSNSNRKSISELIKELDKNKYMIVLNHQPNDYKNESEAGVDLVLSGHSHGGQMFPLGPVGILFGQNDNYYGHEKRNNTDFIVTSGISDWRVLFKTGTKSEYVIIDIKKK